MWVHHTLTLPCEHIISSTNGITLHCSTHRLPMSRCDAGNGHNKLSLSDGLCDILMVLSVLASCAVLARAN